METDKRIDENSPGSFPINPSREMAYQQLTDLRVFCAIMEEIDLRYKIDGPDNAIETMRDYDARMRGQITKIDRNLNSIKHYYSKCSGGNLGENKLV